VALAANGLINAGSVAGGVWFGKLSWPKFGAVPVPERAAP
jgi:hypothetical protein